MRPFGPPSPRGEKREQGAPNCPNEPAGLKALRPIASMAKRHSPLFSPAAGRRWPEGSGEGAARTTPTTSDLPRP
ncbi:hypothetical protein EFR00_19070 [Rhizobium sophoriradicis]|nr:hypothetical protein EFR00_19070 [Rhizobium sophoriradicis]